MTTPDDIDDAVDRILDKCTGTPINREGLLNELHRIEDGDGDIYQDHLMADDALLRYINDPEITAAYQSIEKWYA